MLAFCGRLDGRKRAKADRSEVIEHSINARYLIEDAVANSFENLRIVKEWRTRSGVRSVEGAYGDRVSIIFSTAVCIYRA